MLTIDTPVMDLLDDPITRPVVERHLANLARRLQEDEELVQFFGNSTPRDLSIDPHVRGFTQERLMQMARDLTEVQEKAASN